MSEDNKATNKGGKQRTVLVNGLAGLIGTCAGKSVMHPVDTVKAKLQVISIPGLHEGQKSAVGKGMMTKLI